VRSVRLATRRSPDIVTGMHIGLFGETTAVLETRELASDFLAGVGPAAAAIQSSSHPRARYPDPALIHAALALTTRH
jgi:hypothetical protein